MTVVYVAVPMLRGKGLFKIEKGRRWSVVEHLMLDAVARNATSAEDLSHRSGLPRRIVVEAFIRLMRVGWVEIAPHPDGPIFRATASGAAQASAKELKPPTTLFHRWMAYSVDRLTGSVFRGREIIVRAKHKIDPPEEGSVAFLEPAARYDAVDLAQVFSALENEDEVILGTASVPQPLFRGYGVFKVSDGKIESFPSRGSESLRAAILGAAANVTSRSTAPVRRQIN